MVLQFIAQAFGSADKLKQIVLCSKDLVHDDIARTARFQLQKIYLQIILLDLEYAIERKLEHDLWNIGFKNYIDTLQQLIKDKKNPKRSEHQSLLNICLESASGFYSMLLEEICVTFSFNLPFTSHQKYSSVQSSSRRSPVEHLIEQPKKTSCLYICQHCLVHLGDIARYRFRCKQAEIFYRNAIIISPSSGQPYNQLALLETCRGDKLATVFYYVRSIAVRNPFPAATSNLSLTLKKNNISDELDSGNKKILSTSEFIKLFLKMHAVLYWSNEILSCPTTYIRLLSTSLTAHIAMESFTSIHLIQMMVINMYTYHIVKNDAEKAAEDDQLATNNKLIKNSVMELIVASFSAFLLPIYTYKQEDSILQYFALPALKITLDWIRINPHVLEETSFTNRPQIWPAFCKLLNDIGPFLSSFSQEKYENITLPEDQDIQGFLPLKCAIPGFRYVDSELDLDSLNKLRASRIQNFALWLANETKYALIEVCKEESKFPKFNSITPGIQSSNELIIQQLEDLLKNDSNIAGIGPSNNHCSSPSHLTEKSISTNTNFTLPSTSPPAGNRRSGILKAQSLLDKKERIFSNESKKSSRHNVALQTILKRNQEQEQEHKQVTFKTPSPCLSPNSSNPESTLPLVNQSKLWSNNTFVEKNIQLQSHPTHSIFMPSFTLYNNAFHTLPKNMLQHQQKQQLHPQQQLPQQTQNMNYNIRSNPPLYQSNVNSMGVDLQQGFVAGQMYPKPGFMNNDHMLDIFTPSQMNPALDMQQQNAPVNNNVSTRIPDGQQMQLGPFPTANQVSDMNFLPLWKQQESNSWWMEEKQKVIGSSLSEEQSGSAFYYRNQMPSSTIPQSGSLQFGSTSNQLQFSGQPPQLGTQPMRPILHQQTSPGVSQQQKTPLQSTSRSQSSQNIQVSYWPNTFKKLPLQNNVNSSSNNGLLNKQSFHETPYNQQAICSSNSDDKNGFTSHSQLPINSYSLFSPMWNSQVVNDNKANKSSSNKYSDPLAVLTHQSIWSEGISPLQKLLEQQKQVRDRSMYHNLQQSSLE